MEPDFNRDFGKTATVHATTHGTTHERALSGVVPWCRFGLTRVVVPFSAKFLVYVTLDYSLTS
jgi:hypothetical protein